MTVLRQYLLGISSEDEFYQKLKTTADDCYQTLTLQHTLCVVLRSQLRRPQLIIGSLLPIYEQGRMFPVKNVRNSATSGNDGRPISQG